MEICFGHDILCCIFQIWISRVAGISECCYTIEKELLTMRVGLGMAELALVDYFVMGEAIGIVATLFVSFY